MGQFPEVDPDLDLPALDARVLALWRDRKVFQRSVDQRVGAEPFVFYEGPPTANGRPGVHHVEARVFKDLFPRFRTMRGYRVDRKGGWDCHGLPVELEGEKELGLKDKQAIERYGVEAFNARCRESVKRYVDAFEQLTERIGFWIDTSQAYWTMDTSYVESVWWALAELYRRGLLVEDYKVSPYCPRCQTTLSDAEVAMGYMDIEDLTAYVALPATSGSLAEEGAALLVWTTQPWTLVPNVSVVVGPGIDYVLVGATAGAGRPRRPGGARRGPPGAARGAPGGAGRHPLPAGLRPDPDHRGGGGPGLDGGRRLVRHHRRRLRPGPDFAQIRGRGPGRGPALRHPGAAPGRPRRHLRVRDRLAGRPVRQGGRRRPGRGPARPRAAVAGRAPPPRLPALLALRHPADLLRPDLLVRPDHGQEGPAAGRERPHRLASRAHPRGPLRR